MANKKFDLIFLNNQRKEWRRVNIDCLNDNSKEIFLNRKHAVDMYIDGSPISNIFDVTGICISKYVRFIQKCCELDENGIPFGYTGLIPYKHIQPYKRKEEIMEYGTNYSGAIKQLFERYPDLKDYIDDLYLKRDKNILEKNMIPKIIMNKFWQKCHQIGIKEYEYPFNTKNLGERSLYRYIAELDKNNSDQSISRNNKNARQKYFSTGLKIPTNFPCRRPFSKVQIDGHKIDCIATIRVETIEGDVSILPIKRFWLLTLIDVATRAIIGYHVTINEEYNRFDILACIKNAIVPRKMMDFTIHGLEYPENGGYPSLAINDTKWALFDEIELDNALAHHAQDTVVQITEYLHSAMNFGPVSTPERRGIIERFFQTLEAKGFHRLVSTTGTGITDPRRERCEEAAIRYEISFQHIVEIIEVLIANYNVTQHTALNNFPPLDVLRQRIDRGMLPVFLEEEKQKNFLLLTYSVTRRVNGNKESGRRPYIQFENAEYRSDELSMNYSLIGKKITIMINPDDLRTVKAFLKDGSELGDLYVSGKWAFTPHTLKQRQDINKFIKNK